VRPSISAAQRLGGYFGARWLPALAGSRRAEYVAWLATLEGPRRAPFDLGDVTRVSTGDCGRGRDCSGVSRMALNATSSPRVAARSSLNMSARLQGQKHFGGCQGVTVRAHCNETVCPCLLTLRTQLYRRLECWIAPGHPRRGRAKGPSIWKLLRRSTLSHFQRSRKSRSRRAARRPRQGFAAPRTSMVTCVVPALVKPRR
jgi:hypothetical protein